MPSSLRAAQRRVKSAGETAFHRMRQAAVAFDRQLRDGLDQTDVAHLEQLLSRLHTNVTGETGSTLD